MYASISFPYIRRKSCITTLSCKSDITTYSLLFSSLNGGTWYILYMFYGIKLVELWSIIDCVKFILSMFKRYISTNINIFALINSYSINISPTLFHVPLCSEKALSSC